MKLIYSFLSLVGFLLIFGCASTQNPKITEQEIQALGDLVESRAFEFRARWARPLTTTSLNSIANAGLLPPGSNINNIDLIGNNNYFKMNGDSVTAYFPYYGERQFGGGYNPNSAAIQFEGVPKDIQIEKNAKGYSIKFNIQNSTETYQVNANLFPNKNANVNISSSHRFPIAYSGQIVLETLD